MRTAFMFGNFIIVASIVGVIGAPPVDAYSRLVKSYFRASGSFTSMSRNVGNPNIIPGLYLWTALKIFSFVIRPMVKHVRPIIMHPRGNTEPEICVPLEAIRVGLSAGNGMKKGMESTWCRRVRCVWTAPLLFPVVPLVQRMRAMSSGFNLNGGASTINTHKSYW